MAIGHLDLRGKWIRVNDRYCEILGYERDELMLLHLSQITHPEDAPANLAALELMKQGKLDYYAVDKRYLRKDGSIVWVSLQCRLYRDDQGLPRYNIDRPGHQRAKTGRRAADPERGAAALDLRQRGDRDDDHRR